DEWTHPVTVSINRVTISNTKSDERPADFPKLLPTGNQNVAVSYTTKLLQNRPNPCRYMTLIPYELSATTHVRLEILNLEGIIIEMPVDKIQSPGHYTISYDARDLPAGIYLYRLQTGKGYVKSKKMSVIK
ncbi:MAG: T9SS type A sorting domain-containing protein, partial [Bacteroidales bacterium]|nr:T9SS type A sorting domain-containing protein [Bacteroidales bacterium]